MKFTWFNLMPWPYLPDDFREKNRSVWVDIDSSLFDPVKSHEVYNTYMDLLEYAGTLGFDGIGVNEQSPETVMASCRARTSSRPGSRGARRMWALSCSAIRSRSTIRRCAWAEEVRDARLHFGRAAGRGLSCRHVDGHELLLWPDPGADAREICRGARSYPARVERAKTVRLQRPLQQACAT